jgi:hypothetical protein
MEALIDYNRFVCAQRTVIRSESFHSLILNNYPVAGKEIRKQSNKS